MRVLTALYETGFIPILYHRDLEVAMRGVDGVVEGGSRAFEYTNRGEGALRTFEEIVRRCRQRYPQLIVGAGSIHDPHVGAHFISAGADFIVSPLWSRDLAKLCNGHKVAHIPGAGSVTEIADAEAHGIDLVKLFPAGSLGGPSFIKAILGPRPWTSIVPTSGVAPEEKNVKDWIAAGAACLGMGTTLWDLAALERGHDPALPGRVRDVLRWIGEARADKPPF
jgi:2-dehydro-3-deoxyphosphogluconate aldolase/(4S)-4-hydroxy-2-oxoglutarate aldolase